MDLRTLFPRTLVAPESDPPGAVSVSSYGSKESAAVLGALFVRVYFERGVARRLGWRGILPNSAGLPAWSCRVAGSLHTFGLYFDKEVASPLEKPAPGMPPSPSSSIWGAFKLFIFPEPDATVLETFPLQALSLAMSSDYQYFIRNFVRFPELSASFYAGELNLGLNLNNTGLALELNAPLRQRIFALDGVRNGQGEYIVRPRQAEADFPAFRLLLPLLSVLAASLEEVFTESCRFFSGHKVYIPKGFDAGRHLHDCPEYKGVSLSIRAELGEPVSGAKPLPRKFGALPLQSKGGKNSLSEKRPVLHILSGFLGSGKTTFLKEWLNFLHDKNRFTGVVQNEFGAIGLDAHILKGETVVEELDDGCVCCSLADSLRPGLLRLMKALPAHEFILETSGLANSVYVREAVEELSDLVVPGLTLVVVDALDLVMSSVQVTAKSDFIPHFSGVRLEQIISADVLIINKTDLINAEQLALIESGLSAINNKAAILRAEWGRIPFSRLDAIHAERCTAKILPGCLASHVFEGLQNHTPSHLPPEHKQGQTHNNTKDSTQPENLLLAPVFPGTQHHPHTHMVEGYNSRLLEFAGPLSRAELYNALQTYMPGVCRIKGVVEIAEEGLTTVQYSAGRLELEPCPQEMPKTGYLVFIGKDI